MTHPAQSARRESSRRSVQENPLKLIRLRWLSSRESVQTKKEPPTCAGGSWSFMAPRVGFEPTTLRLTAGCSAVELPRNFFGALRFLGARKYYRHFNYRRNPLFQKFFRQPIPGAWLGLQVHPNTSISLSNSAGHVRLSLRVSQSAATAPRRRRANHSRPPSPLSNATQAPRRVQAPPSTTGPSKSRTHSTAARSHRSSARASRT